MHAFRSIALALAVAAGPASAVSWDRPGENPYRWSVWHAVMSYKHIPAPVRVRLALRARWSAPDFIVAIDRYGMRHQEGLRFTDGIRDMHFGMRQTAPHVTMERWAADHVELAPMWCDAEHCVGSPYVCSNIFWTKREFQVASSPTEVREVHETPEGPGLLIGLTALVAGLWRKR